MLPRPLPYDASEAKNRSFDDVDDVKPQDKKPELWEDTRFKDEVCISTWDEALAIVRRFRARTAPVPASAGGRVAMTVARPSPWRSLKRNEVADDLERIVVQPRFLAQGALSLCGPAAFFNVLGGRHPAALAQAAVDLFETGRCTIGKLQITPDGRMLTADYPAMLKKMEKIHEKNPDAAPTPPATWMLLGALRNSAGVGVFKGDPDQEVAGITLPGEIADWFRQTGFFSKVTDDAQWNVRAGLPSAGAVCAAPGFDSVLLVNTNLFERRCAMEGEVLVALNRHGGGFLGLGSLFSNHYVTLLSEIVRGTARRPPLTGSDDLNAKGEDMQRLAQWEIDNAGRERAGLPLLPFPMEPCVDMKVVRLSIWTWGKTYAPLEIPEETFIDNFFGAITTVVDSKLVKVVKKP